MRQDDLVVGTGTGLTSFTGFSSNIVVTRSAAATLTPTLSVAITALATVTLLCLTAFGLA